MFQKVFKQGRYPFSFQIDPFTPNNNILGKKHKYNFDVLLGPLYCAKLKKSMEVGPKLAICFEQRFSL